MDHQISIAEDAVHFSIYPPKDSNYLLSALATCISNKVDQLLPDSFIWHKDSWHLSVSDSFLAGHIRVGDCLDDEWVVVWLIREISKTWPDLCISVDDQDGSFLLIEAADYLPSWVKPSNAENRVWIHNGRLHLVPIKHTSPAENRPRKASSQVGPSWMSSQYEDDVDLDEWISLSDAISATRSPTKVTFAPPNVERAVWDKISRYPEAFSRHTHTTRVYIPSDIAKALSTRPELIQKAVEAFYTRDAVQLRAANRMSRFPPSTEVPTSVRMTRTAYAQLSGQKFFPPKIFGRWEGESGREGTHEWKRRDVGMKIAVGFEMLFQESKNQTRVNSGLKSNSESAEVVSDASLDALRRSSDFQEYIKKLSATTDYFKGEQQGSRLWNDKERKAAASFLDVMKEKSAEPFASMVNGAISHYANGSISLLDMIKDSDDWLNLEAEDLDSILNGNPAEESMDVDPLSSDIQRHRDLAEDRKTQEQATRLQDLASKVGAFVEGQGEMDGALVEEEQVGSDDDGEVSDVSSDSSSGSHPEDDIERQDAMDKLVAPLAEGEYGKMPSSYYEHSQEAREPVEPKEETDGMDGMEDDSGQLVMDSVPSDQELKERVLRRPVFTRDKYDGVDSDDESSVASEDYGLDPLAREDSDVDTDEDRPTVVDQEDVMGIDMAAEEEEFLAFSRKALGIGDDQWRDILGERKGRGAYVPKGLGSGLAEQTGRSQSDGTSDAVMNEKATPSTAKPSADTQLDSFEAVMQAMDVELARVTQNQRKESSSGDKGKGKAKGTVVTAESDDEEMGDAAQEMDQELRKLLGSAEDEERELGTETSIDYNLIKNFLESMNSQGGESGPVGVLASLLQKSNAGGR